MASSTGFSYSPVIQWRANELSSELGDAETNSARRSGLSGGSILLVLNSGISGKLANDPMRPGWPLNKQGFWCAVDETVTRGGVHPRGGCEMIPAYAGLYTNHIV